MATLMLTVLGAGQEIPVGPPVDRRNPFVTSQYVEARRRGGDQPILVGSGSPHRSIGFERVGWMRRVLEMPSMPVGAPNLEFWQPLIAAAVSRGITRIEVGSYAAIGARLPEGLAFERRWNRAEHLLDLGKPDLVAGCHRTHRQRYRQAGREGCSFEWHADPGTIDEHSRMIAASMSRRQGGVEVSATRSPLDVALLATGAAQLALVRKGGQVVASTLVLLAPEGGYLHSSGSSAEGKGIGAHHFLVVSVAERLKAEGRSVLNLGGTRDEERGLREFKNHFGAEQIESEGGSIDLDRPMARLGAAAETVFDRLRGAR